MHSLELMAIDASHSSPISMSAAQPLAVYKH